MQPASRSRRHRSPVPAAYDYAASCRQRADFPGRGRSRAFYFIHGDSFVLVIIRPDEKRCPGACERTNSKGNTYVLPTFSPGYGRVPFGAAKHVFRDSTVYSTSGDRPMARRRKKTGPFAEKSPISYCNGDGPWIDGEVYFSAAYDAEEFHATAATLAGTQTDTRHCYAEARANILFSRVCSFVYKSVIIIAAKCSQAYGTTSSNQRRGNMVYKSTRYKKKLFLILKNLKTERFG